MMSVVEQHENLAKRRLKKFEHLFLVGILMRLKFLYSSMQSDYARNTEVFLKGISLFVVRLKEKGKL